MKVQNIEHTSKVEIIILIASYLILVAVNAFSEIFKFAGVTAADVSNEVFTWFAPAGYVFSIWSVIYIGLIVWIVRYIRNDNHTSQFAGLPISLEALLFVTSCVLNIAWLIIWHLKIFAATIPVIIALLITVSALYVATWKRSEAKLDRIPIAIYASWLTVATIANIAHVITRTNTSFDSGLLPAITTLALLFVLAIATFVVHHFFNDYAFGIVIAWAGIGVGVHLIPVAPIIGVISVLVSTIGIAIALLPWEKISLSK